MSSRLKPTARGGLVFSAQLTGDKKGNYFNHLVTSGLLMTSGRKHQVTGGLYLLRDARGSLEVRMSYTNSMKNLLQQHCSFSLCCPALPSFPSPYY